MVAIRRGEAKLAGKTVVGVWKAEAQGLPYVTMTVTNEGGSLSGAVLFYLQRKDGAGHVTASAGVPEPLLHPRFDGRTLAFDVSHRRAHPPGSLQDPPVHFRLALTDRDRATLMKANVPASSVTLVRGEY